MTFNGFVGRMKAAWRILWGGTYPTTHYATVTITEANNKFVQLVPWRDIILALDAQGKIWVLNELYPDGQNFAISFLMESPRVY